MLRVGVARGFYLARINACVQRAYVRLAATADGPTLQRGQGHKRRAVLASTFW